MTFPRSLEEQAERQARLDVFAALGSFPALLTCHGELWTLHGHKETEYERVRTLFATPDDLRDLTGELRTHRRVPGVWEALKNLPPSPVAPHGADGHEPVDEYRYGFIAGYAAAYPASIPRGGRFVSLTQLDLAGLEVPRGTDAHGYRNGLEAYAQAFAQARSGQVDPGRLTPPGPTLPEQQEVTQ